MIRPLNAAYAGTSFTSFNSSISDRVVVPSICRHSTDQPFNRSPSPGPNRSPKTDAAGTVDPFFLSKTISFDSAGPSSRLSDERPDPADPLTSSDPAANSTRNRSPVTTSHSQGHLPAVISRENVSSSLYPSSIFELIKNIASACFDR